MTCPQSLPDGDRECDPVLTRKAFAVPTPAPPLGTDFASQHLACQASRQRRKIFCVFAMKQVPCHLRCLTLTRPHVARKMLLACGLHVVYIEGRMKILDVPQSGSVAGTTSSRNRFGQYRRTRAVPVNPNTTAQQAARNALVLNSVGWRGLADEDRSAWDSYSLAHPVVDGLGQSQVLTGFQQYVGVNSALISAGLGTVVDPPTGPVPDALFLDVVDATAGAFEVVITAAPVPAATAYQVEASPPLSPGRSFNKDFRLIKTWAAAAAAPKITAALLTAKFGTLSAGQKFFFRVFAIASDGSRSALTSLTAVLT